jgi:hypothetical protein
MRDNPIYQQDVDKPRKVASLVQKSSLVYANITMIREKGRLD